MKYNRLSRVSRAQKTALALVLICLAVVSIATLLLHSKKADNLNDVKTIQKRVGTLYLLPTAEQPALATVTDSSKLSSSFAGKVENGDKILIYEQRKQAIVYRPSINKIVDVEPVQIDSVQSLEKTNQ